MRPPNMPTSIEGYRQLCFASRSERAREATILMGQIGEEICLNIASEAGFKIIFLAKVGGGGPALSLGKEKGILPDFELRCPEHRYGAYLDAKTKSGPVWARNARQLRHGIDRRNWEAYKNHGDDFGQLAGLFLCECFKSYEDLKDWSGAILVQSLEKLGEPYPELGREYPPKVYWRRNQFRALGHWSPEQWAKMALGSEIPKLESHFHATFNQREQKVLFA